MFIKIKSILIASLLGVSLTVSTNGLAQSTFSHVPVGTWISQKELKFVKNAQDELFIVVCAEKPFAYIARGKQNILNTKIVGINFRDKAKTVTAKVSLPVTNTGGGNGVKLSNQIIDHLRRNNEIQINTDTIDTSFSLSGSGKSLQNCGSTEITTQSKVQTSSKLTLVNHRSWKQPNPNEFRFMEYLRQNDLANAKEYAKLTGLNPAKINGVPLIHRMYHSTNSNFSASHTSAMYDYLINDLKQNANFASYIKRYNKNVLDYPRFTQICFDMRSALNDHEKRLKLFSSPNFSAANRETETNIITATAKQSIELLGGNSLDTNLKGAMLVECVSALINTSPNPRSTIFSYQRKMLIDMVTYLTSIGANVNYVDVTGRYPKNAVSITIGRKDVAVLRALQMVGANLKFSFRTYDKRDHFLTAYTTLEVPPAHSQDTGKIIDILKILRTAGVSPDAPMWVLDRHNATTYRARAQSSGNLELLRALQ